MKGLFISFEGCEGSGKSTLIAYLSQRLQLLGLHVCSTYEPGGTDIGNVIRSLILHDERFEALSSRAELFLFLASRAEHVEKIIVPHLQAGAIVLCDRYVDSTIAYQAYGRGGVVEDIEKLCTLAVPLLPDHTVYLDVDLETSQKRVHKRQGLHLDRIEKCEAEFHARVLEGFRTIAKTHPDRVSSIDARKSVEEVCQEAFSIIEQIIQRAERV